MSDQKSSAGEPMSNVTREGKMNCKHCGFEIEFITDRWIKVVTDGVYCVKNPDIYPGYKYGLHAPSVSRETSAGRCKKCNQPKEPSRAGSRYCRRCDGRDPVTGLKPEAAPPSGEGGETLKATLSDAVAMAGYSVSIGGVPAVAAQGQKDQTGRENGWPDLVYGDKQTFWGNCYSRNGESKLGGNINAWYESAVFWRNRAEGVPNKGEGLRVGGSPARSVEARECKDPSCKCAAHRIPENENAAPGSLPTQPQKCSECGLTKEEHDDPKQFIPGPSLPSEPHDITCIFLSSRGLEECNCSAKASEGTRPCPGCEAGLPFMSNLPNAHKKGIEFAGWCSNKLAAPSDTGREQPSEIAQCRFCKQMGCQGQCLVTPANIMHLAFDFTPPRYDRVAQEGFAKLDELASERVAPAQAQPERLQNLRIDVLIRFAVKEWRDDLPEDAKERIRTVFRESIFSYQAAELRASDPQKGQGWVSVASSGLPKAGEWCWVVIGGVVQHQAAELDVNANTEDPNDRVWNWADSEADAAPLKAVTHYQYIPAPPSVPAGPQEEKKT